MKTPISELSPESYEHVEPVSPLPRINSRELLGKNGILLILHEGQQYQLRVTKAGKLILTK